MLRKLFKYDFIAIGKSMWLLTLIVALTTVVGAFSGHFMIDVIEKTSDTDQVLFAQIALIMLLGSIVFVSFMAVMAYAVLSTIMITKRYYTNLFTDEGYLTFTLPVKTSTILDAKILSGILWGAIQAVVSVICLGFLLYGVAGEELFYIFDEFYEASEYLVDSISAPAYHYVLFIIEYVLITVIGFVFGMLLLYFCITLATVIVKKARVILGVAIYMGVTSVLSTATQIVSTLSTTFMSTQDMMTAEAAMSTAFMQMHIQMWFSILLYGSVAVASYVLNRYFLKKKLNLV